MNGSPQRGHFVILRLEIRKNLFKHYSLLEFELKAKIAGYVGVVFGVIVVFSLLTFDSTEKSEPVFHATLADPSLYIDDVYFDAFLMPKGEYRFRFVPNGDSPQMLTIKINGPSLSFVENFILEGDLQNSGISEYYTWHYLGSSQFWNPADQQVQIIIDPNGNLMGPYSIDIIPI